MKKILLVSLVVVSLLSSCQKNDQELPSGERPDERLSQLLTEYKTILTEAEYGWKAELYPSGGDSYIFFFDFSDNDRVTMVSDINASAATQPIESTYRLKAMQRPSLLFDTYSYLHILSDPDPAKSGGEPGAGKYSDFEFSFDSVATDFIELTGNFHGSKLRMVKATQQDVNTFRSIAANILALDNINNFTTYFKRLTIGDNAFDIQIDSERRQITFFYYEGEEKRSFTTSYNYTIDGITLSSPFVRNNLTITNFTSIQYNALNESINFTTNASAGSIRAATEPVRIDLQSAQRFHESPPGFGYYIALSGFTLSGVVDSLAVSSLPDFSVLVYWPKYGDSEGTEYDLLGFVFGNSINYGSAAVPVVTSEGKIIFNILGTLGEIPPQDEPIVSATTEVWTDPEGFYVVQTGADTYDLVSADGATAWISFF